MLTLSKVHGAQGGRVEWAEKVEKVGLRDSSSISFEGEYCARSTLVLVPEFRLPSSTATSLFLAANVVAQSSFSLAVSSFACCSCTRFQAETSLSIWRFWGKRGKMEAKNGES